MATNVQVMLQWQCFWQLTATKSMQVLTNNLKSSCRLHPANSLAKPLQNGLQITFKNFHDYSPSPFKHNRFPSPERRGVRGEVNHLVRGGCWNFGRLEEWK